MPAVIIQAFINFKQSKKISTVSSLPWIPSDWSEI